MQDDFANGAQGYPMKTSETSETTVCLQMLLLRCQKLDRIFTDNAKEFAKACLDFQWNHDTSTPRRSGTNGVAEGALRRVKGGKTVALVQSGLPDEWQDCAMEYKILAEFAGQNGRWLNSSRFHNELRTVSFR